MATSPAHFFPGSSQVNPMNMHFLAFVIFPKTSRFRRPFSSFQNYVPKCRQPSEQCSSRPTSKKKLRAILTHISTRTTSISGFWASIRPIWNFQLHTKSRWRRIIVCGRYSVSIRAILLLPQIPGLHSLLNRPPIPILKPFISMRTRTLISSPSQPPQNSYNEWWIA